jgi:hypothetical protein
LALAETIDIDQIYQKGDLRSVFFHLSKFVNANISKEDITQFRTPGALRAFFVFHLGIDFLMTETRHLETERAEFPYHHQDWLVAFRLICLTVDLESGTRPGSSQVTTAFMPRKASINDGECTRCAKRPAINNIKRFFCH